MESSKFTTLVTTDYLTAYLVSLLIARPVRCRAVLLFLLVIIGVLYVAKWLTLMIYLSNFRLLLLVNNSITSTPVSTAMAVACPGANIEGPPLL